MTCSNSIAVIALNRKLANLRYARDLDHEYEILYRGCSGFVMPVLSPRMTQDPILNQRKRNMSELKRSDVVVMNSGRCTVKIIECIRSRRKLSFEQARLGFLTFIFLNLAFTRFCEDDARWRNLSAKCDEAVGKRLVTQDECNALKAYSMFKIFKYVDAELLLKSDQTIVYKLMQEVGFTYV